MNQLIKGGGTKMADNGRRSNSRGLASADEETRRRVGQQGGEATKRKHGSEFYHEIGKKGGETISRNRQHMSEIGRKGGEASRGGGRRREEERE